MELFGVRLIGFNSDTLAKLFLTAAIVFVALVVRAVAGAAAWRTSRRATRRSVWIRKGISLAFGTLAMLLLFPIWFDRPDCLATFSGLVVAGGAVASQKAVLSLAGYFIVVFGKVYDIGDRIQLGDVRGDVLDIGLFKTTVMEMGVPRTLIPNPNNWITSRQYTGRVVTFTNSEVFEQATFNYSRMFGFLWEELRLPLHFDEDVDRAEAIALAAAHEATDDTVRDARRELDRVRQHYPLQPADLEPQSYLRITDNWVEASIRFLVRAWGVRATKDGITRAILARYRAEGISIASATFELVKAPELSIRTGDARAMRPEGPDAPAPWASR